MTIHEKLDKILESGSISSINNIEVIFADDSLRETNNASYTYTYTKDYRLVFIIGITSNQNYCHFYNNDSEVLFFNILSTVNTNGVARVYLGVMIENIKQNDEFKYTGRYPSCMIIGIE